MTLYSAAFSCVFVVSLFFQVCLGGGRVKVELLNLVSAVTPPLSLGGGNCDVGGGCDPFLRICFTDTNVESCDESAYYSPTYTNFPVDFQAELLPAFEITDPVIDTVSMGVFLYDRDSTDRLQLSANTPLADLSQVFQISRGVTLESVTSNMYTINYRFTAVCDDGFFGDDCATACVDSDSDVLGHFTCSNSPQVFDCLPGYTDPAGSPPCNDILSLCVPSPCLNGGSCTMTLPGRFVCTCAPGWTGTTCTEDLDECAVINPCVNGGACSQPSFGQFDCACPPNFSGPQCETQMNRCDLNLCINGATCLRTLSSTLGFQCICARGYTGALCEEEIDQCDPNPCVDPGSTCTQPAVGEFICTCPPGITGRTCSDLEDICLSDPCKNGGTCTLTGINQFECSCPDPYQGPTCEEDVNECELFSPCQNGGQCVNAVGGLVCCCPERFTGFFCESVLFKYDLRDFTKLYITNLRHELNFYCPDIAFKTPYLVHVIGQQQDDCFYWIAVRYLGFSGSPHDPLSRPARPDPAQKVGSSPNVHPGNGSVPVVVTNPSASGINGGPENPSTKENGTTEMASETESTTVSSVTDATEGETSPTPTTTTTTTTTNQRFFPRKILRPLGRRNNGLVVQPFFGVLPNRPKTR